MDNCDSIWLRRVFWVIFWKVIKSQNLRPWHQISKCDYKKSDFNDFWLGWFFPWWLLGLHGNAFYDQGRWHFFRSRWLFILVCFLISRSNFSRSAKTFYLDALFDWYFSFYPTTLFTFLSTFNQDSHDQEKTLRPTIKIFDFSRFFWSNLLFLKSSTSTPTF